MTAKTWETIADIVAADLCIGCGLCEALGDGVRMTMTRAGSLRPAPATFDPTVEATLLAACPGVVAEARIDGGSVDPIWGAHRQMVHAWAGDPGVRHRAATGGALTALGVHVLESGMAEFVLHVGADPDAPMRSRWVISESVDDVRAATGSRYGPTAPLAGLDEALGRGRPFAVIAKPCDLNAVHRLAAVDERVDRYCVARFAMVCGGQSRLTKSEALLAEFGVAEEDVTLFRYRGFGNPGPTVVETSDGSRHTKTYLELWEDEGGWDLETRCKLCPDALGEAADIAAADVWPGGSPTGEDEGFNGLVVRTAAGEAMVAAAVASGAIEIGDAITPREFDDFQPHQVRRKEAAAARHAGMADAGLPVMVTIGLRVDELGPALSEQAATDQRVGTARRLVVAAAAVAEGSGS